MVSVVTEAACEVGGGILKKQFDGFFVDVAWTSRLVLQGSKGFQCLSRAKLRSGLLGLGLCLSYATSDEGFASVLSEAGLASLRLAKRGLRIDDS